MFALRNATHMSATPNPPKKMQQVDREGFRQRLLYIREKTGLNKTEFAASIGISKSNYSQVEAGNRMLTVDQIYTIWVVYNVPMEYLMAGQEVDLPARFRR